MAKQLSWLRVLPSSLVGIRSQPGFVQLKTLSVSTMSGQEYFEVSDWPPIVWSMWKDEISWLSPALLAFALGVARRGGYAE